MTHTPILDTDAEAHDGSVNDWIKAVRRSGAKSKATERAYRAGVSNFTAWLAANGLPTEVEIIERKHIQRWLDDLADNGRSPATRKIYSTSLSLFLAWAVDDGIIKESPFLKIRRETVTPPVKPVITEDQIEDLYRATKGRTFEARRNRAMILLLLDTGARRGEMVGMKVEDVDFPKDEDYGIAHFLVSKTEPRPAAFSAETADALRTYIALRKKRRAGKHTDALWIGQRGAMSGEIMRRVVRQIGEDAGIEGLHPHLFRHTAADRDMSNGHLSEGQIMAKFGWKNRAMLDRYGASQKQERSLVAQIAALKASA